MGKQAIYYFSRSGKSEKMAQEIALNHGIKAYKIDDEKSWKGAFGFIKGGYYASSKKCLPAKFKKPEPSDKIVLITPVWASAFPPAVRTFINIIGRGRITLIANSNGGVLKERDGFAKVIDVVGKSEWLGREEIEHLYE